MFESLCLAKFLKIVRYNLFLELVCDIDVLLTLNAATLNNLNVVICRKLKLWTKKMLCCKIDNKLNRAVIVLN